MNIYLSPLAIRIGKLLLAALSLLPTILCFVIMLESPDITTVVSCGCLLLPAFFVFGKVCSVLYAGSLANGLVDFLLSPKRYLSNAPVVVSRQRGMILNGMFIQARDELLKMQAEHPGSAEVADVLSSLFLEKLGDRYQAVNTLICYFNNRKNGGNGENEMNLKLALRLLNVLCEINDFATARLFLAGECEKSGYSDSGYRILRQRLAMMPGAQ